MKLHYSPEILRKVSAIVEPFKRKEEWKALRIPGMPSPYSLALLTGSPGTGKTTLGLEILKDISSLPKTKIVSLSMADVGSGQLGQTEKAIATVFKSAL